MTHPISTPVGPTATVGAGAPAAPATPLRRVLALPYDDALAKVEQALGTEGFGVLTRIDMRETMKKKLGVDFRRYTILGACNPPLAHRALTAVTEIGLFLPCNVIVYELDDGGSVVAAVDPLASIATGHDALLGVATEVHDKLARVIARVA